MTHNADNAVTEAGGESYRFKNIHNHSPADVCRRSCPAYGDMLMEKTAARFNLTQTQNERGEWVPAIPLPLYVGFLHRKCRCDCGQTFRSGQRYREHYALRHILGLS